MLGVLRDRGETDYLEEDYCPQVPTGWTIESLKSPNIAIREQYTIHCGAASEYIQKRELRVSRNS